MEPLISIITLGVADMARFIAFFRDGLGFPTNITGDTAEWAIFRTAGTRFAIYPKDLLVEDIAADHPKNGTGFGGITLAHNVRSEAAVAEVLEFAITAAGTLLKAAQRTAFTPAGDPAQVAKDFSVLAHSLRLKFSHESFNTSLGDSPVSGGKGQATSQRHSAR